MSQAHRLGQRISVLRRQPGRLSLGLPPELDAHATALVTALRAGTGMVRVDFDAGQRHLQLDYLASLLTPGQVAGRVFALLETLPPLNGHPEAAAMAAGAGDEAVSVALADGEAAGPLEGALAGLRATLQAALGKAADVLPAGLPERLQPLLNSALTEKALTNFANDVLAFYLIKVHWDLISRRWLQQPLAHSQAWLSVFYLVFLLVRYRKSP
ncbi:MAG: hypothetical protein RIR00_500 [Pseudomonadota bacterium]|jgi:hypothetical protein